MWHLVMCNLKGRLAYNAIIVGAVALALTVVLAASFMTDNVRSELEDKQLLLGPELALVPLGTKETGHIYLTKGPPQNGYVPQSALSTLRSFPEVIAVSCQRFLGSATLKGNNIQVIGFDPATDFMVTPWQSDKATVNSKYSQQVIIGNALSDDAPDLIEINGKSYFIAGHLRHTGSFLDKVAFIPMPEADMSSPTWILVGIKPGTSVDMMVNKFETNIEGVEVIVRPELLKTIHESLHGVVEGGSLDMTAFMVGGAAFLVTAGLFSLLIHERQREFGLLKAMGARNSFVFKLIVNEACILGIIGGIAGIVFTIGWHLALGTVDIDTTITSVKLLNGALLFIVTVVICVAAALIPAILAARMDPYSAIRSGNI